VLLTSGCQGALSCATRQGGLLLDGADGDPDLVRHQGGAQDSDGGNQASDGLVGHNIPSVCPSGERRQGALILEPSTRSRYRVSGLATERVAFQSPLAVGLPDEVRRGASRTPAHALTLQLTCRVVSRCARHVINRNCSGLLVPRGRAELFAISAPRDILTIGWGALECSMCIGRVGIMSKDATLLALDMFTPSQRRRLAGIEYRSNGESDRTPLVAGYRSSRGVCPLGAP
jgi:hypothetical protein